MKVKKRIAVLIALAILSQMTLFPARTAQAKEQTRVVITVSVGGAALGFYFFLHLIFRTSMMTQPSADDSALLNHDAQGWKVGLPAPEAVPDRYLFGPCSGPNASLHYRIDVLKIRF